MKTYSQATASLYHSPTLPPHEHAVWDLVNLKSLFYGLLLVPFSLWLLLRAVKRLSPRGTQRAPSQDVEKPARQTTSKPRAPERPLGVWTPVEFTRPAPEPYPGWDLYKTLPLPYRPFRYGPYHITMGLRTMKWEEWIELDTHYLKYHADKAARIKERGEKCCKTAPEAFDGAVELLEEL